MPYDHEIPIPFRRRLPPCDTQARFGEVDVPKGGIFHTQTKTHLATLEMYLSTSVISPFYPLFLVLFDSTPNPSKLN